MKQNASSKRFEGNCTEIGTIKGFMNAPTPSNSMGLEKDGIVKGREAQSK